MVRISQAAWLLFLLLGLFLVLPRPARAGEAPEEAPEEAVAAEKPQPAQVPEPAVPEPAVPEPAVPEPAVPKTRAVPATPMIPLTRPGGPRAPASSASSGLSFQALEREHLAARSAWQKALMRVREEGGTDYPADPDRAFFPRFRALADADNLHAMAWCFRRFRHDDVPAALRGDRWLAQAFSLLTLTVDDPALAVEVVRALARGGALVGATQQMGLYAYAEAAHDTEAVVRAAMRGRAELLRSSRGGRRLSDAEAVFEELVRRWPDSAEGRRAASTLFVLRNLQVGMTAPELAGDDVDGRALALEDYRGRVVVLEFWGFW